MSINTNDSSNNLNPPPLSAAVRLRALLADSNTTLLCPGVYDGFTARIALQAGFDVLYMSGAGTSMSLLGMPDLGITTSVEMATHASTIASLDRNVPLIADADTGGTGPLQVRRTVHAYMAGGVAALHLEDQVATKRCGHLANKELVDEDVFLSRIRAAVLARTEIQATAGPAADIVIIARTDALQSFGYDEAVKRLKAAVEVGADVAFLEGITAKEDMRRVCKDLAPTPVLLNIVKGGVTPEINVGEAKEMGFRIVIFPTVALGAVYEGVGRAMMDLHSSGSLEREQVQKEKIVGPRKLFEVCGLKECTNFDMTAGGKGYVNGV